MTYFSVTNINGKGDVNNNTPFIVIHTNNIHNLLYLKASDEKNYIYRFREVFLNNILKRNELEPSNFRPIGDVWYNSYIFEQKLSFILVNKQISQPTNNFTIAKKTNYGKIYHPTENSQYTYMGCYYEPNINKPKKGILVDKQYVRYLNEKLSYDIGFIDDFNTLGVKGMNMIEPIVDDNESLNTIIGEHVVLTQSDYPWYIEKGKNAEDVFTGEKMFPNGRFPKNRYPLDKEKILGIDSNKYFNSTDKFAEQVSNVKLDRTSKNLGMGYSFEDRLRASGEPDYKYETFKNNLNKKCSKSITLLNYLMFFMIIIILLTVAYDFYRSSK